MEVQATEGYGRPLRNLRLQHAPHHHIGRKTFICFALSNGIPPDVVMKFTGHCDYKSIKPYIDITESAKKDAIKKMGEAFKKK